MQLRLLFPAIFSLLILGLTFCAADARRHYKVLGRAVAWLDIACIPPILGNLIIVASNIRMVSLVGYYIYFIGMDFFMYELFCFTCDYCRGASNLKKAAKWIRYLFLVDTIQIILNPLTKHTFSIEPVVLENMKYYRMVPHLGQQFHRVVDYGVFFALMIVFIVTTIRTSKIYRERYSIVLITMGIVGALETYYIFARVPIDRSMIGFGLFGILIYYICIHYRPLGFLDRILSGIVSNGSEAIFIFTAGGRCVWTNKEGCYLVGVQENNCENAPELLEYLFDTKLHKGNWNEQFITGGGDSIKYYELENRDVINENKQYIGYYLKVRDVTKEQLKLKREMYEATHDRLTGLYTKEYLFKMISDVLASRPLTDYLVLFLNIKNFKIVNDIFGAEFGDQVLKHVATYLKNKLPDKCIYGRLAGDNFGILFPKDSFPPEKVEEVLSHFTMKNEQTDFPITVQIGVYEVTHDTSDPAEMFAGARLALSTLSDEYTKHIAYYDEKIRQEILWNQEISAQLLDAIEARDIRPYLQPIADRDGNIVGAEALVRWIHKEHGFLAPYRFIPCFEKNGMIAEIDKYMWQCACEILASWQKKGWDLFVSVNISPKDFYFMDVPTYIKGLVRDHGIDPRKFRVEITETVMMSDTDKMIGIMQEFREAGFIVEMDDFGSGYSSLNMLKDMPIDVLKIDMKFLGSSDNEKKADTIVKNVINLSLELGMTTLTEGVETQLQYNGLSNMGCKLFQGYYFSKPIPVEDFEKLVIERQSIRPA